MSLVTATITTSAFAFFFYKISQQGLQLQEQIAFLQESRTKESSYFRLNKLAQETEVKRNLLTEPFFNEEGDSIIFLGEIESLATALGLDLETESLEKVVNKDTNEEKIKITFSYAGKKDTVLNFSKLMEVIPYHSSVESLDLKSVGDNNWNGELTILITINSL
jgi:hypothetical protein